MPDARWQDSALGVRKDSATQDHASLRSELRWRAATPLAHVPGTAPPPEVDDQTLAILRHRRRTASIRRRGWLVRRMLLVGDAVGLAAAFLLTFLLIRDSSSAEVSVQTLLGLFAVVLPLWVVLAKVYGLYDRDEERTEHTTADDLVGVLHLVTVGTWLTLVGLRAFGVNYPEVLEAAIFWVFAVVCICAGRVAARAFSRGRITYLQNTVVYGAGHIGQMVARKLVNRPEHGINLVGFVDDHPRELADDLSYLALLGRPDDLPEIVRTFDVERVVIAFSHDAHEHTLALIRGLSDLEVQVDIVPRLFETIGPRVDIHTVEGVPLIGLPPLRLSRSSLFVKRAIDLLGATIGLVVLVPVAALIAIAVRVDSRGPAFYRSQRVGRDGTRFGLFKFRTMRVEAGSGDGSAGEDLASILADPELAAEFERTHKLVSDPRVTRVGAWLRRHSLDELPQLLNVITGDMSLVGPRPITAEEYELYCDAEGVPRISREEATNGASAYPLAGYWEVEGLRPGITGYWQVSGRSEIPYDERVRLDMAYVKGWSLKLDSLILVKTLRALLSSRGAH
jgi:exopolysaccharide biosynthesis polyprenyl glycosylphosphotransferase